MMATFEQRISRMEAALDAGNPYANWTDEQLNEHIHHLRQSILLSVVMESALLTGPMHERDRSAVNLLMQYLRRIKQLLATEDRSHGLTDPELREATKVCRALLAKYRPDDAVLAEFDRLMVREEEWPLPRNAVVRGLN